MSDTITGRTAMELVSHEAIVTEAYRDAVGVWTWGVGITDASGHSVDCYKDNPQTISHCLAVFEQVLRARYLPSVLTAFAGRTLCETELAAALSFHYNTGGIRRASWVQEVLNGDTAAARLNIMNWTKASGRVIQALVNRRTAERDLFFDGIWSNNGLAQVIAVKKPAYTPDFRNSKTVDISADIKTLFG